MHGVVSVLDGGRTKAVEALWAELDRTLGLRGVYVTPYPHFSWQVAGQYDLVRLEPALRGFAAAAQPFTVQTTGLGVFTGTRLVLYIPVVRTEELSRFHRALWSVLRGIGGDVSDYYTADRWVPHLTLGFGDLDRDRLGRAVHLLAERSFDWALEVDNLALVYDTGIAQELRLRVPLAGAA